MPDSSVGTSERCSLTQIRVDIVEQNESSEKLKLIVEVKNSLKIERNLVDTFLWTGEIACSPADQISIKVYKRGFRLSPFSITSFKRKLVECTGNVHPLQDPKKMLNVQVTLGPSTTAATLHKNIDNKGSGSLSGDLDEKEEEETRSLPSRRDEARMKVAGKQVIAERLRKVYMVMQVLQSVGEVLEDLHPAVKVVAWGLDNVIKACENQRECRDAAERLLDELEFFIELEPYAAGLGRKPLSKKAVGSMLLLVKQILEYICAKTKTGAMSDLVSQEYREMVTQFKEQFATLRKSFNASVAVESFNMALNQEERQLLQKHLNPSEQSHSRVQCMDQTRVTLLHTIKEWMKGSSSMEERANAQLDNIFWLSGLPGSGKTSVAGSVAAIAADQKLHLSTFFCKRGDPSLSSANNILPTLAFSVCEQDNTYRDAILSFLSSRESERLKGADVGVQFELLFKEPFEARLKTGNAGLHVIVIDALDECSDKNSKRAIAQHLTLLSQIAPWFRVFVTSRPEEDIISGFSNIVATYRKINISDDKATNDHDIRIYTMSTLKDWDVSPQAVDKLTDQLVARASGLFIWCSTLFKNLSDSFTQEDDLNHFLSTTETEDRLEPLRQLFELYNQILDTATVGKRSILCMRLVLEVVLISERPLSCACIAKFVNGHPKLERVDEKAIRKVIRALQAVVYEDDSVEPAGKVVRTHHPSFLDFLKERSDFSEEWMRTTDLHHLMAKGCLQAMREQLKFNIFELGPALIFNEDIPNRESMISTHVSEELLYGCEFWTSHASRCANHASSLVSAVEMFVCRPTVLFWFEVMSMLGLLSRSEIILHECYSIFQAVSQLIAEASTDLARFVASFSASMASIPHIYLSALTWLPSASWTYQNLASQFRHHPLVMAHGETHWDALVWSKQTGNEVRCLACSPDGRHIVCGSGEVLQIRDVQTGDLFGSPLKGHSNDVTCVAYSSDGQQIVSGSRDSTLQRWDAKTGEALGEPLKGHTDWVRAVAYSPDGQHIISGSDDRTIRLWDARSGAADGEPLKGHEDYVLAVAYSYDNQYIVSASADKTVRRWDATTGAALDVPFQGHADWVLAVAVSANSKLIISGSRDKTLCCWEAETGQPLGKPLCGHADNVHAVACSSDGQYIVSGSDDRTIRQWNAQTREAVGEALKGHTGSVRAISYTTDGRHIISGSSDGTLCRWDARSGGTEGKPIEGRTSEILTIAFSPDGKHISSRYDGGTLIQIWDAETGVAVGEPLRGLDCKVRAVAYSPDGQRIVSVSSEGIAQQRDGKTGIPVGTPLRDHDDGSLILAVTYSPDSQTIISGSSDYTLQRWSAQTGEALGEPLRHCTDSAWGAAVPLYGETIVSSLRNDALRRWGVRDGKVIEEPLQGHSSGVTAVAYSPDGQYIVSGSYDSTLRQWDASSGQPVGAPLRGHTKGILSVAYSLNNSYILSGSLDKTVRLWDAKTGTAVGRALRTTDAVQSLEFAPDGRHIAYAAGAYITVLSIDTFKSLTTRNVLDLPHSALIPVQDRAVLWNICCNALDNTGANGWVKHGDKLLLCIPSKYRAGFLVLSAKCILGKGEHSLPIIDTKKLFEYLHDWRQIYSG